MQTKEILETIKMIDEEYLDIRTITMGISCWIVWIPILIKAVKKSKRKIRSKAKILSRWAMSLGRNMGFRSLINESVLRTPIDVGGSIWWRSGQIR